MFGNDTKIVSDIERAFNRVDNTIDTNKHIYTIDDLNVYYWSELNPNKSITEEKFNDFDWLKISHHYLIY